MEKDNNVTIRDRCGGNSDDDGDGDGDGVSAVVDVCDNDVDMLRIVCISDTHGRHRSLTMPPGDWLIHGGDITHFGKVQQIHDFNEWLSELSYKRCFVVGGNHEGNNDAIHLRDQLTNATVLHCHKDGKVVRVPHPRRANVEVSLYGLPFLPLQEQASYDTIPAAVTVLVTHEPPQGILDRLPDAKPQGPARGATSMGGGSRHLLRAIARRSPVVHVFGHVHAGAGAKRIGDDERATLCVNAANCGGRYGYAVVNQPTVVGLQWCAVKGDDGDGVEGTQLPLRPWTATVLEE